MNCYYSCAVNKAIDTEQTVPYNTTPQSHIQSNQMTYPEYFAVLVITVLPGVVLPGDSELVLAHIAQAGVLACLHLLYEPAGKLWFQ